ncbi:flavocytochrome C flavin subunit [Campylobacter sputorum subsp. bubulus]|uniref:Flavocytochrome C flavin subunit n=1 Tax=Campylobacter sputorum subsp. sputorum TaxID=32024 RepID=A0A381DII0_9BACT|nr:flavocytochrome c [Campylobacter sputorum]ASM35539.1 flavocytochrome c [Campylobacter sputorum aubsp. sputorum RM3237]ASM37255.1 flavocytochrome c [Campylobacter sputorum bv. faecalis CCUG 20703]KAB0582727.1 flavocytochrome c [Campylobacter sputorum subsp. sputorum]QEL05731.1 flavocytochrome c [Campylobacter sputorum subsp. sputorum]SUX08207.1 flavocytochrome C flavin subunit [Campylobacter sputorum subsp. bubulus]
MNHNDSRRKFIKLAGVGVGASMLGASNLMAKPIDVKDVKFDEEYDVVVIGTGFAGLAAAAKAAEKGLSVLVIEKMGRVGGNSTINGGGMAVPNNPIQKERNIKDSKEIFIKDCLKAGLGINHVELLETIVDRAADSVSFAEKCGAKFQHELSWFGGHSVPRTIVTENNSGSGIIIPMSKYVEENEKCKLYKRTKFDEFVLDEAGRVVGIKARVEYRFDSKLFNDDKENKSGEVKYFGAKKGVVLASGGFGMDKFYRKLQDPRIPDDMDSTNHPGATAGAMAKAFEIGACPVQVDWIQFGPWASPDERGFGVAPILTQQGLFKYGMAVDVKTGKRFMNELADRKTRADAEFVILRKDPKANPVAIGTQNTFGPEIKNVIQKGLDSGVMKKYNTLDEVAIAYKIPAAALKESVKKYNDGVKAGKDEFGKPVEQFKGECINESGPFYCIRLTPKPHHTMGGVKINTKAQVISMDTQEPIPGLYAAGEVTGGTHGASRLGSVAITDCLVFGMIAGENI